jgi:hypothetical protein
MLVVISIKKERAKSSQGSLSDSTRDESCLVKQRPQYDLGDFY